MELFIKVYFWLSVVSFVLRCLALSYIDYPRKIDRGVDGISLILALPFLVWAAILYLA